MVGHGEAHQPPRVLPPVVLEASPVENERRVASSERRGHKLADSAGLRRMRATDAIQHPLVPEMLVLDTTDMTAEDAAAVVVRHVTGLREAGRLLPAGDRHRRLAVGDSAASSPA